MSRLGRLLRHLFETRAQLRRRFTPEVLDRIQQAVAQAEASHGGQLRVVVESDLDAWSIIEAKTPRARALEVYALAHVWDTHANNGVLLYVLFADRAVEIVADRGFNDLVTPSEWQAVCSAMQAEFSAGRWEHGALAGIGAIAQLLARHFPATGRADTENELPDRPLLL
jgi:uncharacterized membrane protein